VLPGLPPVMRLSGPVVLSTLSEFQSKVFSDHSHNLILDISNARTWIHRELAPSWHYM
jgi:hypothetical protein